MKALPLILTILLLTLFCTCGGVGGSETTNGVMAGVVYPDGTPAEGSTVRLRKADYVSDVSALSKKRVVYADSVDMVTDSRGRFIIDENKIDPGDYCIEIINNNGNSSQSGAVLFKFTVKKGNGAVDLGTDTLRSFAALSGEIDNGAAEGRRLYVQIKGLERLAEVAPNGTFAFHDLPAGTHNMRIVDGASVSVREVQNVRVSSGDTLAVKITGSSQFSSLIQINTSNAAVFSFGVMENFPLLIRLESPAFDFSSAHPTGNDIRFSKLDGRNLPYEIEQWDPASGKAAVWTLIDTIRGDGSDQFIIMNWGAPEASSLSNGAAVFDTAFGFRGVWHFNEDPAAGINAIRDRTVNGFHGKASPSMTSGNVVSGVAGGALQFNGISDFIEAGLLELNENYTLSCWVKIQRGSDVNNWNLRFIIKEQSYTLWYDTRWGESGGGFRAEHFIDWQYWRGIYQDTKDSLPNRSAELDVWYHVAATYDGDKIRLFINGEQADSTLHIPEKPQAGKEQLLFGGRVDEFFKGTMDEVRIERAARSAQWIKLCYETQRADSTPVHSNLVR